MEQRPQSTSGELKALSPEQIIQGLRDLHGEEKFAQIVQEARAARMQPYQEAQIDFCKKYNVPYSEHTNVGVTPIFDSPEFYALCDVNVVPPSGLSGPPRTEA